MCRFSFNCLHHMLYHVLTKKTADYGQLKFYMRINKFKKLKSMSVNEIFFRMKEKFIEIMEQILNLRGQNTISDSRLLKYCSDLLNKNELNAYLFDHFKHGERNLFFTESYDKAKRLEQIKQNVDFIPWLNEADAILSGKTTLLGKTLNLDNGSHIDPIYGIKWPEIFYKNVTKEKSISKCDIKYIWEINRHQYLIVLGKAYWITGDEKYAEKVFATIQNWIIENPYNTGVNWTSSLELAVRSISWIWALFFCKDSKFLSPEVYKVILKSLFEHGMYISRHLSYFSSPYNHLIGEAAGLHMIGCMISPLKKGKKWEETGWHILKDQVEKQFHSDGMCVEQASFYHHFTLGFYLQAVLLRKVNQKPVSKKILDRIEKAVEFSIYLTKPDKSLPMIGDIDNARSIPFSTEHSWDFSGLIALGSMLFSRSDFKFNCTKIPEEIFWMLNENDFNDYLKLEANKPLKTSIAFKESGYYILRDSWKSNSNYLCFDCGNMADGLSETAVPSAAHGHADALSFELSAFGKSFIVEGGFYTYFGDIEWHKYFRHEEAHNTIQIGNYRQGEYAGRLTWQNVQNPVVKKCDLTNDHDMISGCLKYKDGTLHERQIMYVKKKFWLVNDIVKLKKSKTSEKIKSYLHFHPLVHVDIDKDNQLIYAKIGNVGILIKFFAKIHISSHKGGKTPSEGWVASGYGIKHESWNIELSWTASQNENIFPFAVIPWQNDFNNIEIHEKIVKENGAVTFQPSIYTDNTHYMLTINKDVNFKMLKTQR